MAFFGKKDKDKPSTLEEVRKAYEDLSDDDKKSFHQSLADRVHESVAAQEIEHGQEDSQSAEAREHEALGEEHADGKGDTEELHESDDTAEEKAEDKRDEGDDRYASLMARIEALESRFKDESDSDEEAAKKAEKIYGVGNGVFAVERKNEEKITPKEAAEIARKQRL